MRALVVLTTASVGPGEGIGLSAKPTLPIPFITKARIAVDLHTQRYAVRVRNVRCPRRVCIVNQATCGCDAMRRRIARYAQDAREGGSPFPPTIVRKRERRAASRLSAAPPPRRPAGGAGVAPAPPLARIGDCQRRAAVERGARIRE